MRSSRIKGSSRTLKSVGEFGLIDEIKKWAPCAKDVIQGIGDDAAVLRGPRGRYQLLAIDTIVEGVDFRKHQVTAEQIGWKALAINLSDLAAMGGIPRAAVVSLVLPPSAPLSFVKGLYRGIRKLAHRFDVSIVGGDVSRGSKIISTVAVLGESQGKRIVFRRGARIGDFICVTGRLGGSILGKHLNFTPRVREGQFLLASGATAMIDISDGLVQDLYHLARRPGMSFMISEREIPVSEAARRLVRGSKRKALNRALHDGEDFELLFTISPPAFRRLKKAWARRFPVPLTAIGRVVKGCEAASCKRKRLGFQHF